MIAGFALGALMSSAQATDFENGKRLYMQFCAACHGPSGMSLRPDAPNLRLQQGLAQSDVVIVEKLKRGSAGKPPMMGLMSDRDLYDVVTYSRGLR